MRLNASFKKILRIFKPACAIGSIEISDGSLNYFAINSETSETSFFSMPLPQGVIVGGIIKQKQECQNFFRQFAQKIPSKHKTEIPVFLSISDANVYTQIFSVPQLERKAFKEAVELNVRANSPLDYDTVYADWEKIRVQETTNEAVILASYAERRVIDEIVEVCSNAGFIVMAIEQKAISHSRLIKQEDIHFTSTGAYFTLVVNGDGLSFSIMRDGRLHFTRYTPWSHLTSEGGAHSGVTFSEFRNLIVREIHQISNFYTSRFNEAIKGIYILAPGFEEQIKKIIQDNFSYQVLDIALRTFHLDPSWYVVLGSALRGLIPRAHDEEVSVAPEDTEKKFMHTQALSFIGAWRTALSIVTFILIISHLGALIFLNNFLGSIQRDVQTSYTAASIQRLSELTAEAEQFNRNIARAVIVRASHATLSPLLNDVYSLAGSSILIDRVTIQSASAPITIYARTTKETFALEYKNRLDTSAHVMNVNFPLSSISQIDANTISFRLTLNLKAQGI